MINTSDACAAESAVICRTQANALRGLGVEGSDAAGRKTPDNHAQIEWNLRRSLRNAAIGAQLIQPEGLEVSPLQTSQLPDDEFPIPDDETVSELVRTPSRASADLQQHADLEDDLEPSPEFEERGPTKPGSTDELGGLSVP